MRTSASSLLLTMLAGAAAVMISATGACTSSTTWTPVCTENVSQDGIQIVDGGCEGFATCPLGPPAACCVDADGGALTGSDLADCLYGYGGGPSNGGGSGGGDAGSD